MRRLAWGGKLREKEVKRPLGTGTTTQYYRKRPWTTPTFTQMFAMAAIFGAVFALCYVGPDYLAPTECTWGGYCEAQVSQGPPKSTYAGKLLKARSDGDELALPQPAALPLSKRLVDEATYNDLRPRRTTLNPSGWAPYNDPLLAGPNYRIEKNWWTSSSRLGMIAYALLPLSVTLALKLWPFAVFAIPHLSNYGFDKVAIFHQWSMSDASLRT